jgi:hypothetical protein
MKRSISAALALVGVLAFPGMSQAADNFGSKLEREPNGSMDCNQPGPCTFVGFEFANPPNGLARFAAPYDGVVTKVRARSVSPDRVQFAFSSITAQGVGGNRTASASLQSVGPTVTLKGNRTIEEYPARASVKQGAAVSLNSGSHGAYYDSNGGRDSYVFSPPLALGAAPRANTDHSGGELLVQAVIERDADRDGFGDETQDRCKNQAGGANGCDRVKPVLRGLKAGKRKVSYRLSERARVSLKIQRKSGRRYKSVRTLRVRGKQGRNAVRTSKRLRKLLKGGRYRVVAQARDGAGNKSAKKVVRFRVKR